MTKKSDNEQEVKTPPEPPAPPKIPEPPKYSSGTTYVVAPGKSLCCGGFAGIIAPGGVVTEAHLGGTAEQAKQAMQALITRGILVKK